MVQYIHDLIWPEAAIYLPWDVWIVTWLIAALWANRTVKTPEFGREIAYRLITLAGFALVLVIQGQQVDDFLRGTPAHNWWAARYWALPAWAGWTMVGLVTFGFLFAWWARIHLGRLWSGRITRKEGHKIVDTGPYALVRHPIYTGIILAGFATAAVKAIPTAILGAVLLYAGYWMKARLEERFLREELGPKDYDAYRARVPMLIPFGPRSF